MIKKWKTSSGESGLFTGVQELVDNVRPYLENGTGEGFIMICTVKTPEGAFTRHAFSANMTLPDLDRMVETIPTLALELAKPCNCPACQAKRSARTFQ